MLEDVKTKLEPETRFVEGSPGAGVIGVTTVPIFFWFSKRFLDFPACLLTIAMINIVPSSSVSYELMN